MGGAVGAAETRTDPASLQPSHAVAPGDAGLAS